MFLRQPITQARRQQQIFIRVVRTVAFAHETLWGHPVSERQPKLYGDIDFSDGLLVADPALSGTLTGDVVLSLSNIAPETSGGFSAGFDLTGPVTFGITPGLARA